MSALEVDLAQREHRVGEGGHEEADRDLAGLVLQERLHDPGRELTHRELDDDHRDGQDERGRLTIESATVDRIDNVPSSMARLTTVVDGPSS